MRRIYLLISLSLIFLLSTTSPLLALSLKVLTPDNIDRITELHKLNVGGDIHDIAWSPVDDTFAIAVDNTIQIYSAQDWQEPAYILEGHQNIVWDIAFSPDGKYLVSGSGGIGVGGNTLADNTAKVWDLAAGNLLFALPHPTDEPIIESVAFNHDGSQIMTVTMSFDTIRYWNTQTGEFISQLDIEPLDGGWPRILSSEFSPDGTLYAMGSLHNDLKIWRLGIALEEISDLPHYGAELTFDSSGHKFAAANRYGAYTVIHDLNTVDEITTAYVFNMQFSGLAFSPDGQMLAQAGYWHEFSDLILRFWDSDTGKSIFIIDNLVTKIEHLAFNPEGTILLSANIEGNVVLWGIEFSEAANQ